MGFSMTNADIESAVTNGQYIMLLSKQRYFIIPLFYAHYNLIYKVILVSSMSFSFQKTCKRRVNIVPQEPHWQGCLQMRLQTFFDFWPRERRLGQMLIISKYRIIGPLNRLTDSFGLPRFIDRIVFSWQCAEKKKESRIECYPVSVAHRY